MKSPIRFTFLGTGTSQGVPLIGCPCHVCQSQDPKDKRLRTSLLIETDTTTVVIDSGPDFRQQLLRAGVKKLDALIFTHSHKDHLAGMDDIRAFNYLQNRPIDVFATKATEAVMRMEFSYIFSNSGYPGIPEINLITIDKNSLIDVGDIRLQALEVMHYKMPVLGFRIGDFTYITDANHIAEEEMEKIKGSQYLVLNALRKEKHISHFTLDEAIVVSRQVMAPKTYFTHISHQLGLYADENPKLPEGIQLAFDMLQIEL
ncbi:MAG: MBL fold metallo-hydrolase [Chitinophagaceae bacterium]|nr:MBL fold metallo-hydrolase [Chitinophagaceae bacterium]